MQLPQFLQGVVDSLRSLPRKAYFIAIPVPIFLVTVAITLATSGGGDDNQELALNPTVAPSLQNVDEPATSTATAVAQPTNTPVPTVAPPNRADCSAIQGTEYESPEEREWYLANCLGSGTASTNTNTGGGGGTTTSPSGQAVTGAAEYALGDRMIIPSLGIDASVNGVVVPANGAMPNPIGYFNFIWYDFSSNFGGLGGYAGAGGNHVVGCHVDSAIYGAVICWHVRSLSAGAQIQYIKSNGEVLNYTVTSSATYSANSDFAGIVASGTADLTIITCTGTFSGGSYDLRHVVTAVLS